MARPLADEGEMHAEIGALRREIAELRAHMDERFTIVENKHDTSDTRLRSLELWRAYITGALAVMSFMIMTALAWLAFFAAQ